MLKRFLIAVIVAVLVTTSQIAAAVDWNSVPHFNNKAELATYIENGRRRGQTTFYFVLPSVKIHNEQERKDFQFELAQYIATARFVLLNEDGGFGTGRFIYNITEEYISTRVANAYLSGDTSNLTSKEIELYNKALPIVNEAKKYSSSLERELYIHDAICKRVKYKNPQDNPDAFAALVIGETNCQGYSDAFYMLGRMSGLDVRRIGGKFGGEWHVWNAITFEDGKTYCLDVTQDDIKYEDKHRYIFFNAPLEVVQSTYQYPWEVINLQQNIDNRYSYRSLRNHAQASSAEEGLNLIAQKMGKENFSWFSVMAPYDERFSEVNNQQNADYVAQNAGKVIVLFTVQFGKYLFFTGVLPNS